MAWCEILSMMLGQVLQKLIFHNSLKMVKILLSTSIKTQCQIKDDFWEYFFQLRNFPIIFSFYCNVFWCILGQFS